MPEHLTVSTGPDVTQQVLSYNDQLMVVAFRFLRSAVNVFRSTVKDGDKMVIFQSEVKRKEALVLPINLPRDTIAAGDSFSSGALSGYLGASQPL
jgi:sugar/nucleoside kinase (ribokinase family)